MSNSSFRVLLIGDQPECLRLLHQQQFEAVSVKRLADGLAHLTANPVGLVLLTLALPDVRGTGAFVKLHEAAPHLPIVVLASATEEKLAASLMPLGVQDYLLVPELTGPMLARALRNASERHLIREEHSRAGHLLELLMDNIPDLIYFKDKTSKFVVVNRAVAKRFNLADPHLAVGKSDADFFSAEHAQQALADEQRVIETGQPLVGIEEKETWPDGRVTWASTTKMPLRDRAGRIFGTFGISRDITEHRRMEQALAERSAELLKERLLLRTLIDNLPDAIYAKDLAGRKTMANPADLRNLRCPSEAEALGKTDFDFFPPEVAQHFYEDDQKVFQGHPVINREEFFLDRDDQKRWLLTSKLPLRGRDGKIIGLVGIGRDITKRKQAEETLDRERRLLRTLIDNLPDAIYAKDTAGRKTLANLADVKNLHFQTEAEALGKTDFDLFPREHAERLFADDQKVIEGHTVLNREEHFLDDEGRVHWLLTSKLPLHDQSGKIIGLVGINRDITERKLAEDKLAYERGLFRTLMTYLPEAIYFKDRHSRFVRVSDAKIKKNLELVRRRYREANPSERAEDWPPFLQNEEQFGAYLAGRTDFDVFPEERARQAFEDEQRILQTGEPLIDKLEGTKTSDGKTSWMLSTKVPWRDEEGNIIGTFGVSHDITALKETEEKLAEYTRELERKNKQTDEELKMARELQLAMLPHEFPSVPRGRPRGESDLEFFSFFSPAGAVSGDFFDVIPLSDTTVGLFICDVMGHDVRAALVTAMMRALVVDLSTPTIEPGELLAQINREVAGVFQQTDSTMYATAFYLIVDVGRGELRYASAAHIEPVLLHRPSGTVEWLGRGPGQKKGPALGLFAEGQFPTHRCPLAVGDVIALFTDGLIDVEGARNESFSTDRLLAAVRARAQLPTNELFTGLLDEIKKFSAKTEFEDDVCLVGAEVRRLSAAGAKAV
ncbi:MAG TPA: PAS domain-containing protein [Candidatus Acidoferrum sp.]|nr:PAS domain-containing protein [Candidatus Acidoferrum sp.]